MGTMVYSLVWVKGVYIINRMAFGLDPATNDNLHVELNIEVLHVRNIYTSPASSSCPGIFVL